MDTTALSISEARRLLDSRKISAKELTEAHLKVALERDADVRAFLEVWADEARHEAAEADEQIESGNATALTGIPLAIKDNILIEGRHASSGSRILEPYIASYDADVIERLKKERAVFIGRTNMDEFAMGSSTENSAFGPTRNPHDTTRVPGGSSGGSAAAVAMGAALGALGSDTGGSIRQPAAFCGLVGVKPTYGAVSRFGLMPMGSSLNQIGPLAKTVDDARLLFSAIAGVDRRDSVTVRPATSERSEKRVIGVLRSFIEREGIDSAMLNNFNEKLAHLKSEGFSIRDVDMPSLEYALPVYYVVMPAEASTDLARFDGIRYGLSIAGETVQDVYRKTRGRGFGPEVRRRILLGTFVLSAGYADAYYRKAREVRLLLRTDFDKAFDEVDAIVTPTTPSVAFRFGEKSDPLSMYLEDIFTVPVNLAGVPAISVPSGRIEREGKQLPAGFQIIGPHWSEETLFDIGLVIEKSTS